MTVIVRGKINKNNEWVEQQVIFRAPAGAVHAEQRALRLALHLRQAGPPVLHARREAARWRTRRTCPSRPARSIASTTTGRCRRTTRSSSKPGRAAVDLELRPPQSAGAGVGSGHRQAVGVRARPDGRRRDQHHRAGQQLRLGRGHDGHAAGHHQAHRGRHGRADRLLHADDRAERDRLLHRQQVSGLEEQPVRQRARRPAAAPARDQRTTRCAPGSRCSTSSAASTTSIIGPDGLLYVTLQLPGPGRCRRRRRAWWRGSCR